jgi:hypothetical protein
MKIFIFVSKQYGVIRFIYDDYVVSIGNEENTFTAKNRLSMEQLLANYRSAEHWVEL